MAKKIYKLNLAATLKTINCGETLTFTIAGENPEATFYSLNSTRTHLGLNLHIKRINNGIKAIAIGL